MDVRTFIEWLLNIDSDGAGDEDFAVFFVLLYKAWKIKYADPVTEYDMRSFPIDEFTNWLNRSLHEIIDEDSECCPFAWWKKHVYFYEERHGECTAL